MTVERKSGKQPERQLWFNEGIQLKEVENINYGDNIDHFALETDDIEKTKEIAIENGCKLDKDNRNWFRLSNGTRVELLNK